MELNRKFFTRENIFDQKGQVDSMIGRKPDLSNAAAVAGGDMGGNVRAALRLFRQQGQQGDVSAYAPSSISVGGPYFIYLFL